MRPSDCRIRAACSSRILIGTTALGSGLPVKVLGNAGFNVPGLTPHQPLDACWHEPTAPDQQLTLDFLRAVIGATQVKGGDYARAAQTQAIAGFITRLEGELYPLPPLDIAELAERRVREPAKTIAIAGIEDEDGLALARAYAMPGTQLLLIGAGHMLAGAAEGCRRRGAVAEGLVAADWGNASLAGSLEALDFPAVGVL